MSDTSSSNSDLVTKITQIIVGQLSVDPEKVKPDASFTEDLGADSLDVVEITISLENAFNIEISDDLEIVYIEDLIKYIKSKIAG